MENKVVSLLKQDFLKSCWNYGKVYVVSHYANIYVVIGIAAFQRPVGSSLLEYMILFLAGQWLIE